MMSIPPEAGWIRVRFSSGQRAKNQLIKLVMGILFGLIFLAIMVASIFIQLEELFQRVLKPKGKWTPSVFDSTYVDGKNLYVYLFKIIPSRTHMNDVDMCKAVEFIQSRYKFRIINVYQSCYYDRQKKDQAFSRIVFVLKDKIVIEVTTTCTEVFYKNGGYQFTEELFNTLKDYKQPEKEEDFEINIITLNRDGLDLKRLDIKPTFLDIGLYYNDDFQEIDKILIERLNRKDDKGIVLLHGLPGTGKTTYLRFLIGRLKKQVLFVSPSVAGNLMNPEFIDLLIDNPNSVVIIEDAEEIIKDRKYDSNSSVSNLLNLSDGLLSDCLSAQIICTFNSSLNLVDSALMRKGRLIAKYEFGKLSTGKSQILSDHLGFTTVIDRPMTIAEIANQHDKEFTIRKSEVVGFRKQEVEMN